MHCNLEHPRGGAGLGIDAGPSSLEPPPILREGSFYIMYESKGAAWATPYHAYLYVLDLGQRFLDDVHQIPDPSIRFSLDKYPAKMGCVAVGNKIYFVGGVFYYGTRYRFSNKLYMLDTSLLDHGTDIDGLVIESESQYPIRKSRPIVVECCGNICLFPRSFSHSPFGFTVESYNLTTKQWNCFNFLDDLKRDYLFRSSYDTDEGRSELQVNSHFVQGSTIYIVLPLGRCSFNVYDDKVKLDRVELSLDPMIFPFSGKVEIIDGCFFGLSQFNYHVFGFKLNDSGTSVQTQCADLIPSVSPSTKYIIDRSVEWLRKETKELLCVTCTTDCLCDRYWVPGEYIPIDFIIDFFKIEEEQKEETTKKKASYSITFSVGSKECCDGVIQACFFMKKNLKYFPYHLSRSTSVHLSPHQHEA